MSSNNAMLNFESQLNEKAVFPERKYNWSLVWANECKKLLSDSLSNQIH